MLTLTEDEIVRLEALEPRLKEIKDRHGKQGGIPWAFLTDQGEAVVRIPPQPNRFQRAFIGWAPEDMGYLLDQVAFLTDLVERALDGQAPKGEEKTGDETKSAGDAGGAHGGGGAPARGRAARKNKAG